MADQRRWQGSGVQRDDQFVRPPAFRDAHDGEPLSDQGAAWHGSGSRHVALGAALAIVAGIAAVAFMLLAAPSSPASDAQGALGAEQDDEALPEDLRAIASASGTPTPSVPTPTLPPLPTPGT